MVVETKKKCPICGSDCEETKDSIKCRKCNRSWPKEYWDLTGTQELPQESREDIYAPSPSSPVKELLKKVWGIFLRLTESSHIYAATLGAVLILAIGLTSLNGIPLSIQIGEAEPIEFLFKEPMVAWIFFIIGMLDMIGILMQFGSVFVQGYKKRFEKHEENVEK